MTSGVEAPWRRVDVLDALRALEGLRPGDPQGDGELTFAIRAVIDDTWWDQRDPAGDVGRILFDLHEAEAARVATAGLLVVIEDLERTDAPYDSYVTHPAWPEAMVRVRLLRVLIEQNDATRVL